MKRFSGTGVAVVTPFREDLSPDYHSLKHVINHLIDGKVEYLVVMGTTGESVTLSQDEQNQILETFLETNNKRVPIVLGIGGNNTQHICNKAQELSVKYELDGILSVSPYYNKPTQAGIYQHYKALSESTDLPIILYNVPGRTASNISPETTLALAHDFDNIVATKEASGSLPQVMEIIKNRPEGFLVLSGDDSLALPFIGVGAEGAISVIGNALPLQFSNMVRAALDGDFTLAGKIHYELLDLMNLNFVEGNPAGVKMLMNLLGLCEPHVRLPLIAASDSLKQRLQQALQLGVHP